MSDSSDATRVVSAVRSAWLAPPATRLSYFVFRAAVKFSSERPMFVKNSRASSFAMIV